MNSTIRSRSHHHRSAGTVRWSAPLLAAAAALLPAAEADAQLPVGQLLLSTYKDQGNNPVPGIGGLHFIEPTSGTVTSVTGLPCEISGTCPNSVGVDGTDVVAHLPGTGKIVASAWGAIGLPVSLFVLDLAGPAVTATTRYDLATVSSYDGLANPAGSVLADGRVLLALDQSNLVAPGVVLGSLLSIFDPRQPPGAPGAFTHVPTPGAPNEIPNALVVDQARRVAYVGMLPNLGAGTGAVYEVQIPAGSTPRLVGRIPLGIQALALEPDGKLLVGGGVGASSRLARLDPATGAVTSFPQIFGTQGINALRIDPVLGDLFVAERDGTVSRLSPRTRQGTLQVVSTGGPSGWGRPSGLDMHDALRSYGASTGAGPAVRWELGPNPGGSSTLGNANFSLTCAAGDPGQSSFWVLGAMPAQIRIPLPQPIEVLVAPTVLLSTQVQPAPVGNRLTLSLPADPSLRGIHLYAQCLVPRGSALAASNALDITLR